jgi:hypothetical protein
MARKRYAYRLNEETGLAEAVEVDLDYRPPARVEISMDRHYENTAMTDGTDVGSRRKYNEYLKRTGMAPADDFKETWAKAAKEREAIAQGGHDSAERRDQIGRTIYQLEKGRRR